MAARLPDMREAAAPAWRAIREDMLRLSLERPPRWFRPLLLKHRRLPSMTGYHHLWPDGLREFVRVLQPLDAKLVAACPLRLLGDPDYSVPLDPAEAQGRHPKNRHETLGPVWSK